MKRLAQAPPKKYGHNSLAEYELNEFYMPDTGSAIMDIRLYSRIKLRISENEIPEEEDPRSWLAGQQLRIGEELAFKLGNRLQKLAEEEGWQGAAAWKSLDEKFELEGGEWFLEVVVRARVEDNPIKPNLLQQVAGKVLEQQAESNAQAQEREVLGRAQMVKRAVDAVMAESQDVFAPLISNGFNENSHIEYTADSRLDKELDAFLGSPTGRIDLA